MTETVAIRANCAGCLSRHLEGDTATMVLLVMLTSGEADLEQVVRDLCFLHRRALQESVKKVGA